MAYGLADLATCRDPAAGRVLGHLIVVAEVARGLGGTLSRGFAEEAYLAGLVHDVGKLLLIRGTDGDYSRVIDHCREFGYTALEVEQHLLSPTQQCINHVTVGSLFLRAHAFPDSLIEVVETHHALAVTDRMPHWGGRVPIHLPGLVQAANHLAYHLGFGDGIAGRIPYRETPSQILGAMGISEANGTALLEAAQQQARETMHDAMREDLPSEIEELRARLRQSTPTHEEEATPGEDCETCETIVELLRSHAAAGMFDFVAYTGRKADELDVILKEMKSRKYVKELREGKENAAFRASRKLLQEDAATVVSTILSCADITESRKPSAT